MKFANSTTVSRGRSLTTALVLASCLVTTGCGLGSMADLEDYVKATHATPAPAVESLCDQIQCDGRAFSPKYTSSDKRDPFKPYDVAGATPPVPTSHPDPHPSEELEQYPLDSLRMVGTVNRGGRRWGLVRTPDGIIHPIKSGNYLGQNSGKAREIMEHRITLNEVVWTTNGWEERAAILALIEG